MIDLDQVVLRRADEQVAATSICRGWERDSWAISGEAAPVVEPVRRLHCLAGDCAAKPTKRGYCHTHYMKVRAGVALDLDFRARRRGTRRSA